ncbi:MAG TPA: hypothetical protein VKB88_24675 [Bryobacteraceae bacterium]|nr:hypothetical protein [Bryobacteraceae bacterium]
MRLRIIVALTLGVLAPNHSGAHDISTTPVTYSREISRLLNHYCISCHHEGGTAFSLTSYADVRPWAKAIKEEALERRMPPWGAVRGFGDFRDDRSLAQEQIELIGDWVEGGAPEGDRALLPALAFLPEAPEMPPLTRELTVAGGEAVISTTARVAGILPGQLAKGSSLMVVAHRPDATTVPLLWIYGYDPRFRRSYWYREALMLPSGTRIDMSPSDGSSVILLLKKQRSIRDLLRVGGKQEENRRFLQRRPDPSACRRRPGRNALQVLRTQSVPKPEGFDTGGCAIPFRFRRTSVGCFQEGFSLLVPWCVIPSS